MYSVSSQRKSPVVFFRLVALISALILITVATPIRAFSAERPLRIRLLGATLPEVPKYVTVEDLEQLPGVQASIYDPYMKRTVLYSGVLLKDLVDRYASPRTARIRIRAIDEYKVEFSPDDWNNDHFILATRMAGKHIGIKESGPAKIVMQTKDPQNRYVPKWIWMINRIEFLTE
jgi:hypothetical protein